MRSWMLLLATGCASVVPAVEEGVVNVAPEILDARLVCDEVAGEWYFEADVYDADGANDVVEIHAFVYDEGSEIAAASVALAPADDQRWSAVLAAGCGAVAYSADFVVQDAGGASDSWTAFVESAE